MKFLVLALLLILASCAEKPGRVVPHSDMEVGLYSQGGEKDNGAEIIEEGKNTAWFTSPLNPIISCVEVAPDFGVPDAEIERALQEVWSDWGRYFRERAIPGGIEQVAFSYKRGSKCEGDEDIALYLGVRNKVVTEAMKKFDRPVGFAYRVSADFKKGWSQGFIWIASHGEYTKGRSAYPDWRAKYNLKGLLMHELGHVYGVGHVPLTIMDERVSEFLKAGDNERAVRLNRIDSFRDLYACMGCPVDKNGDLGFTNTHADNFNLLVGRPPVGPTVARVWGTLSKNLSLRLEDFQGSEDLRIEFDDAGTDQSGVNGQGDLQGIFRVARMDDAGQVKVTSISHGARVLYGRIHTKKGEWVPVAMEVNLVTEVLQATGLLHLDGIVIKVFNQGRPSVLFYSVSY